MNRHEAIRSPDSFELEAAARYHRTEVWGEAFDAAAEWISSHVTAAKPQRTSAAVLRALPHRAVH